MDGITSTGLAQALAALNDQLTMADARVHLVVIGGSGLIAIDAVAPRDLGLEPNWLNPGPTGLLVHGLPEGFADRLTARDLGKALRVSFASRIDQVFLKLYAAADRREPRDLRTCAS